MNKILINFFIAYKSLLKQKLRSILTILTISIGIASVIAVFSAGEGLEFMIKEQISKFGDNLIEIEVKVPNTKQTSSENSGGMAQGITITTFKNSDIEEVRKHSNISFVYGAIMGQEIVSYEDQIKKYFLMGVGFEYANINKTKVIYGRQFSEDDEKSLAQVAVIGYDIYKIFFGEQDPIGKSIKIKNQKFKIIGVYEKQGAMFMMNADEQIFLPITTMQKKILGTDYLMYAFAKVIDTTKINSTVEDVEFIMRDAHDIENPDKDDFAVVSMEEALKMVEDIINIITILIVSVVCVSLLVAGIGVMNIMYVSVVERTFEVGLKKAIGATKADILKQFLFESLIITFLGGVLGIFFGVILSYVILQIALYYNLDWALIITLRSVFIALVFSTIIGIVFGVYPAKKAANLNPIEALRRE